MYVDAEKWNTNLGRDVILQYGVELINKTVKDDLVPQLLLDTVKEIYQDINSNISSLDALAFYKELENQTVGNIAPKVITSELNKVLQPKEFTQSNNIHKINSETKPAIEWHETVGCTVLADRAVKNALAFDILECVLQEVFTHAIPKLVSIKHTVYSFFLFMCTLGFDYCTTQRIDMFI
ncbi:unnamed protein product [Heterobilharzia americana]|nr:unnamed protein product [Heterobilharzia americana]